MCDFVGVLTVCMGSYTASVGPPVPSQDSVTLICSGVFSDDWHGVLSPDSISIHSMSVEDSWTVIVWPVGSVLSFCTVMRHTSLTGVLFVIVLIGIALPNFSARALVLVRVDLRFGTDDCDFLLAFVSCGGVVFRSTFLAGGICGDCLNSWIIESSDEMEIDVSHSNSMFLFASLRILFGLP